MSEPLKPRTIFDLLRAKMYKSDGTVIDPDDSLTLGIILIRKWWFDGTPIDPWQLEAIRLLVDDRAPLDRLVPPPVPSRPRGGA